MRRQELLEYNIPDSIERYLTNVYTETPDWGSTLQRAVERGYREGGRRGAEYVASVLADRLDEDQILVRINGRAVFVSRTREDNEPVVTPIEDLASLETTLPALAEKTLLPPYFVNRWFTEEDESTVYYQSAVIQRNMRRGSSVTVEPIVPASANSEVVPPVVPPAVPPVVPPASPEVVPPVPAAGTETPLTTFAASNQGGIANNPEEEEAILELQTFLNGTLGLDVGRNGPDSKYGPRTTQAVRDFQQLANTVDGINVTVDGDAGPETINALTSIRDDLSNIQRLTQELQNNLTDGFVPISYKSSIAKLLEKTLVEDDKSDLEALINKYADFIESQQLPSDSEIRTIIDSAKSAIASPGATRSLTPASNPEPFNINWENVIVAPVADQNDPAVIVLSSRENNSNYIVSARRYESNTIPIATGIDPTDFVNVNVPDSLLDKINAEMNRRGDAAGPVEPEATDAVQYGNDLTDNLRIYVTRTTRSAADTEGFLSNILPERMTNEQRAQARDILQPLVLKLTRGDRVFRIDGVDVQGMASTREVTAPSAELIRSFIRDELQDVAQPEVPQDRSVAPSEAVPQAALEKGRRIHSLLDSGLFGYTNTAKQREITQILQSISSREEYIQVNREFKRLSRANESIIDWLLSEQWEVQPIIQHLEGLGVRLTDSITHTLARLNSVLGVKS